jgi:voltage-gated potassium channel
MFSFLMTLSRLVGAFVRKSRDPEFRNILVLLLILIASGTIFYSSVEGWNWFDSLYFCIITLATVGYGDFAPKTVWGKAFTIVYIFVGLGLFVAAIRDIADDLLENRKGRLTRRNKRDGKE